ncbi:YdgA family protein [Pusillimonas sp. MFBS29]|uniref:YdgA family protein n=1 Tax=Pusillimonas sp. MFBS29 TaxID=2886690 RepID=UPI001D0F565F|nr:YdgA family protein [Pusillimonas sp. MFBS29]MCC2595214.1 YdgA family protein [Pusillimonas sp. MFBS29]
MKKSTGVLGVVVVLGAAYVGTSWYTGVQAQKTLEAAVVQANENLASWLSGDPTADAQEASPARLDIDKYERRLFSSDVLYTLRINDEDGGTIELALKDHLLHGPFPLDALREGYLLPLMASSKAQLVATPSTQAWMDSQKGGSPLHINTRVGFGGTGQSSWNFQPVELSSEDLQFSFSGGTLTVDLHNDFQSGESSGQFQALSLKDMESGDVLQLKDIELKSNTLSGENQVIQTRSNATIAAVVMSSPGTDDVSLEQINVSVDSEQAKAMLNGSAHYDFGRILVGKTDMGSLSLTARVQQLDTEALTALATDYEAIAARHGGEIGQEEALSAEEAQLLHDRLAAVLASAPSIAIDSLIWKNVKGESKAGLQVNLTKPEGSKADSIDALFMEGLKLIKFDLNLSKPMFIHAFSQAETDAEKKLQMEILGAMIYDQYVNRLQMAGLIQADVEAATAAVVYEQDNVTVNGKTMSVPEFMQRIFSVVM